MRKVMLFAAAMFAAGLATSNVATAAGSDPAVAAQASTHKLMSDAMNPYMATQPAPKAAKHKKMAKKKKM